MEMVKVMTEELFREKKELVQRLNAMQERIAAEIEPVAKVRRKVEWMEEKERCVELLNKVPHPPPHTPFCGLMSTNSPSPFWRRCLHLFKTCSTDRLRRTT
jgi:hypothetical protein